MHSVKCGDRQLVRPTDQVSGLMVEVFIETGLHRPEGYDKPVKPRWSSQPSALLGSDTDFANELTEAGTVTAHALSKCLLAQCQRVGTHGANGVLHP